MRDVADRAGVSVTTVSHVINDTRPVSDDLRQRVVSAMAHLGYQPNALARSLRRKQSHTLGIILPDSANPFFAEVARGIEDAAFAQDYSVILCNSDGDLSKELLYINVLAEKQVDGILLVAVSSAAAEQTLSLQTNRLLLMVVDREIPGAAVDAVLVDNAYGGRLAAGHLVGLGHRRIGCIAGPSDLTPSAERVVGYRQTLQEAGLPPDESLIIKGDFQYESGYRAAHRFLTQPNRPTAIFACNDLMAVGAVSAALELGLNVPADLSVVGFDDVRLASFTNPPLTTIAQPKYEMGVMAATMLLERLDNRSLPPRRQLLETRLIARQSTAPPRQTAA